MTDRKYRRAGAFERPSLGGDGITVARKVVIDRGETQALEACAAR